MTIAIPIFAVLVVVLPIVILAYMAHEAIE